MIVLLFVGDNDFDQSIFTIDIKTLFSQTIVTGEAFTVFAILAAYVAARNE